MGRPFSVLPRGFAVRPFSELQDVERGQSE